jgi:tetratricopeptide (TPR) repeat protein
MSPPSEDSILLGETAGGSVPLERALLVLSGLEADGEMSAHEGKIDAIFLRFLEKSELDLHSSPIGPPPYLHVDIARRLFDYLWTSKPRRFGEPFFLAEVVDAQLDPDGSRPVGTCVGLTSLYSVLGLRAGLTLSLMVSSDHLLNRLRVGDRFIDLDHTDPLGFDCKSGGGFRELPLWTLTASVLNSRGLRNEKLGRFEAAMLDYGRAIGIHPGYANAFNNRGNMRALRGDLDGAMGDYGEAIRLNPGLCEAHCNRGMARHRLGDREGARQDYLRALALDSAYDDARRCLESLDRLQEIAPTDFRDT